MATLTAVADSANSRVFLTVAAWPGVSRATVSRVHANGAVVPVTDTLGALLTTTWVGWDHEAPLDQAVTYRAVAVPDWFTDNPSFETNVTGWTGSNGATPTRSTAQFATGAASMLVTPNGSTANPTVTNTEFPVTPSIAYTLSGWVRSTTSGTRNLNILWRDAAHSLISTDSISQAPPAGVWTYYGATAFTAPVLAAYAVLTTNDPGTPAASNTWFVDDVFVSGAGPSQTVTSSAVTVASGNRCWLKHLGRPALSGRFTVAEYGVRRAPARRGVHQIAGRPDPIAVSGVRGYGTGEISFLTRDTTLTQLAALEALFADGSVLLLQLPGAWGGESLYISVGDVDIARRVSKLPYPHRTVTVPFDVVQRPAATNPPAVGSTWDDVPVAYATWNAVVAGEATWDALVQKVGP